MTAPDPPRGNKGGRPRAPEKSVEVWAWIPSRHRDQLVAHARAHGRSVSGLIRTAIARTYGPRDPSK